MTRREASPPPDIEGFTAGKLIGVGGYADVFLYEQHRPSRPVAIKVMVADAIGNEQQRRRFTAEADLMARVSTHPYIVPVFQADIARDGRPYIVMEFYPGSNFLERVRREQFSVAEVLRTGIHIASAVETAHRAGILHRDLKPANILTSEFGRAGLTDFGIAVPEEQVGDEAEGLSIPWAPPEAFGSQRLDERADVYSLAATVYHLLAARSPFEISGVHNSPLELMSRIERMPVPPIGRPDVPASLERVLSQAMAKNPAHRPTTAADFGRLLQSIEAEMHLAVTQLELAGDSRPTSRPIEVQGDIDDSTRIRGPVSIAPERPVLAPASITSVPDRPTGYAAAAERRREGLLAEPEVEHTVHRPSPVALGVVHDDAANRNRLLYVGVGVVALVVVVVIVIVSLSGGKDAATPTEDSTQLVNDGVLGGTIVIALPPGVVENLTGTASANGSFAFNWAPPRGATGDLLYQVTEKATAKQPQASSPPQAATSFTSPVPCIEVISIENGLPSSPTPLCVG